jgi:hypothetical protein
VEGFIKPVAEHESCWALRAGDMGVPTISHEFLLVTTARIAQKGDSNGRNAGILAPPNALWERIRCPLYFRFGRD